MANAQYLMAYRILEWCFILLIGVPFAVLGWYWYARKPDSGKLVFGLGWTLYLLEKIPHGMIISSLPRVADVAGPDAAPGALDRLILLQNLLNAMHGIPLAVIGAGFLMVVLGLSGEPMNEVTR